MFSSRILNPLMIGEKGSSLSTPWGLGSNPWCVSFKHLRRGNRDGGCRQRTSVRSYRMLLDCTVIARVCVCAQMLKEWRDSLKSFEALTVGGSVPATVGIIPTATLHLRMLRASSLQKQDLRLFRQPQVKERGFQPTHTRAHTHSH